MLKKYIFYLSVKVVDLCRVCIYRLAG